MSTTDTTAPESLFTRLVDAPQALVFKVWTEREHVVRWMHPKPFGTVECEHIEVRPGGRLSFNMRLPDGGVIHSRSIYREIEPPSRIVYDEVCERDGKVFHRAHMIVSFTAQGEQTFISIHGRFEWPPEQDMGWTLADMQEGWTDGWGDNMDLLQAHVASLQAAAGDTGKDGAFTLTRHFSAPRALVFKVMTDVNHLEKWWGPKGFGMKNCKLDLRPGGLFHYCMVTPDGKEMWGRFVYREIVAPERVVFTNSFSDAEGNATRMPWNPSWPLEVLNTWTFVETGGGTTLHLHGKPFNATEEEQAIFQANFGSMEQGFGGTMDQLDTYLAGLA